MATKLKAVPKKKAPAKVSGVASGKAKPKKQATKETEAGTVACEPYVQN